MFIYKFMAGLVEQMTTTAYGVFVLIIRQYIRGVYYIRAPDEEDSYDPHKHRNVPKPTSYADTMIHMLKGSIGAGVLAMPEATGRLGVIASTVGLLLVGGFATYCIQILIAAQYQLCKRQRKGYLTYPRSMALSLQSGPPCMRWAATCTYHFVDVVLVLWQLGICNIYIVFVAENMQQVFKFHGHDISLRYHVIILLIPLVITCLVKQLKLLTPFSTVSNGLTLLGLILVFYYLLEDDLTFEKEKMHIKGLNEIPIFVGTALFALEAVGVVLAIEYNMKEPKRFVGCFGLFNIGMAIIIVIYGLIGVFGYIKYGDQIQASITLNLPSEEKKAQAAKILIAIAIFLSFPLQNFVAYSIIMRRMKNILGQGSRRVIIDYATRVMLVVIPWALALAVPALGPFISFFGAFCLSLLAMVFPGVMDLCMWYPDQYGVCYFRLIRDIIIIVVGLVCLISGCYSTILEIVESQH